MFQGSLSFELCDTSPRTWRNVAIYNGNKAYTFKRVSQSKQFVWKSFKQVFAFVLGSQVWYLSTMHRLRVELKEVLGWVVDTDLPVIIQAH